MGAEHLSAVVTKEVPSDDCIPSSYVIRIYEGWADRSEVDEDEVLAEYDTNTLNLRAATEFIAMVIRRHPVDPEDVHFSRASYDLELTWRCYAELR